MRGDWGEGVRGSWGDWGEDVRGDWGDWDEDVRGDWGEDVRADWGEDVLCPKVAAEQRRGHQEIPAFPPPHPAVDGAFGILSGQHQPH